MKNIPTEEKTEVFCIDERFYFGVEQYSEDFSEEEIKELPDDYKKKVDSCTLEKIFVVNGDKKYDNIIDSCISQITDSNEDRLPEDSDRVFAQIEKAFRDAIDDAVISKINEALPSLWYPNGNYYFITKADLMDCL